MEAIMEKIPIKKYTDYKNSGAEWLGEIPSHWDVKRIKFELNYQKGKNPKEITLEETEDIYLSMEYLRSNHQKIQYVKNTKDLITVKDDDILLLWDGSNAGEFIKGKLGVLSSTMALISINNAFKKFAWYFLKVIEMQLRVTTVGMGIPHVSGDELKNLLFLLPPLKEQLLISQFLDRKTAQIEQTIAYKERMIELLKERRQIQIQNALIRGLNSELKFKSSDIDSLGEIPIHWKVKKLKYLLKERNERSENGKEPLLMVSQVYGLVIRADFHNKAEVAQSNVGNKKVYENDLVFNKLKAHLGVFFKSNIKFQGIVSPDYAVYFPIGEIHDLKYLELLFRHPSYINQFICKATGIVEGLIRLYSNDLFSLRVPVPPPHEQELILKFVDKINSQFKTAIEFKEQEIEKLKEYKATLINSAVTGKIKV